MIQIDREGHIFFRMEISPDGKQLAITRMARDPNTEDFYPIPLNSSDPLNAHEVMKRLQLKQVTRNDKDQPIRAKNRLTNKNWSSATTVQIPIEENESLEWWFDNAIVAGQVVIQSGEIHIKQEPIQRVIPTEIRLAAIHALPKQEGSVYHTPAQLAMPITDLHTHFAGIMTVDILIGSIKEKQKMGKPMLYPVKYLLQAGITLEDLSIYFKDNEQLGSAESQYQQFIEAFKANPQRATFDITQMVAPENDANPQNKANCFKLNELLHIPANQTTIFNEMEKYYEYRDLFVKDKDLFPYFLKEIAKDYQKQGLKYVEISFSKVTDPEWLQIIEKVMPEIEQETGVQIRFLGIIARTAPQEKRESQIEMYQRFAALSPYVLGMDLLAAEINSTYDILPELIGLCEWAKANYPGMVIRVHAGETSYHPENIAGVVYLAEKYPDLNFRVGHGIYGVHDDVAEKMKRLPNIIPEINMASNVALNMKADVAHHTLFHYIERGIPVVLGSDGHGLYQTERPDLIKLLYYAEKVAIPEFTQQLRAVEEKHVRFVNHAFPERAYWFLKQFIAATQKLGLTETVVEALSSSAESSTSIRELMTRLSGDSPLRPGEIVNDDNILTPFAHQLVQVYQQTKSIPQFEKIWEEMYRNYNDFKTACAEEDARRSAASRKALAENQEAVVQFCNDREISLLEDRVDAPVANELTSKTPLMINGAIIADTEKERTDILTHTTAMIQTLLESMDPNNFYFVTTGTDIGVQKMVHELVHEYNQRHPERKFDLVAYVPTNVKTAELSPLLTHVVMVKDVSTIYNLYEYIDKKVRDPEHGLMLLAIGGTMWNKDVIQVVANALRDPSEPSAVDHQKQLFLFNRGKGAAVDKSRELPATYSSNHYETFLANMIPTLSTDQVAGLFYDHLVSASDNSSLQELHGRTTASTSSQFAEKSLLVLRSQNLAEVSSPILAEYFDCRINRKPVESTLLFEMMLSNSQLKETIENLAIEFDLPETVRTRAPQPTSRFFASQPKPQAMEQKLTQSDDPPEEEKPNKSPGVNRF